MIRIPEQLEYQDQSSEKGSGRNTMKRDAGGMMRSEMSETWSKKTINNYGECV